ncbi:nuclear transport factor 2 family protein [Sphingomonas abietis]|uniref:Nuclear transport factor 2 family protein n=1 Tax=Sphingomonas abietis TaxID=3012344 RepID=A0ABY7NT69_9SPHN|nr:nuclear transport factor 2 family protein [Sphingomonas abietis]WBO23641.1 nuclear transport factor 2 family protein [Sphingomonas abietis]
MNGRLALVERAIARYNDRDAEGYAAFFTDGGSEGMYRGDVLRAGRDAVRTGNGKTFADFPENRAEILAGHELGDHVVLHEKVWRTAAGEPFEVVSIYSFSDDLIDRVEFVR